MNFQGFGKSLVWLLIAAHLVTMYSCTTTHHVTVSGNEVPVGSNVKIAKVVMKSGESIEFDGRGGRYAEKHSDGTSHRVIVGPVQGKEVEIDIENAHAVNVEQTESSGAGNFALGLITGLPIGAGLLYLIAVMASSGD